MLTVIWSTPRTGSNWYSSYLLNQLLQQGKNAIYLRNYFGKYHLTSYQKHNSQELFYEYERGMFYKEYYLDSFTKRIQTRVVSNQRVLNSVEEEAHRIAVLDKNNLEKYPVLINQHVKNIATDTYHYLRYKANKNIFLYRENIVNQLASYVVAINTQKFVSNYTSNNIIKDAEIPGEQLYNLYDRIIHWHTLDKTGCEIVKFEDLDFSIESNIKKQHATKAIDLVSDKMKDKIFQYAESYKEFLSSSDKKI
jgi:hypothetical protein